jgi:hypothetical protein
LGNGTWRRVLGARVVMSWPDDAITSPPSPPPTGTKRSRLAGFMGVFLLVAGGVTITVGVLSQQHAPQPGAAAAGVTGSTRGPSLSRSTPVTISIPEIGVHSKLLRLGLNSDGTIAVPSLTTSAGEAAWYKYSVTPGQVGTSVIEGHVDNYEGPAVFFRLGALRPGQTIDVTLADGVTAIFRVTGVRAYQKASFPTDAVYGDSHYSALRLITCSGSFDYSTDHYLGSTVVFATLTGHQAAGASD